jgi:hypothetical protein
MSSVLPSLAHALAMAEGGGGLWLTSVSVRICSRTKTGPKRHRRVTREIDRMPNLANIPGEPRPSRCSIRRMDKMKKFLVALLPIVLSAAAAFGLDNEDSTVSWNTIVGVITAPGVDNPIGTIHAGAGPWSARIGRARVNLSDGFTSFEVDGLVLNGSNSSGTPGPVTAVKGTLVCNSGGTAPTVLDTASVPLNMHGNAHFSGQIEGVPATCNNPVFLIRIATPVVAAGRWIATGTQRFLDIDVR